MAVTTPTPTQLAAMGAPSVAGRTCTGMIDSERGQVALLDSERQPIGYLAPIHAAVFDGASPRRG